MIWSPKLTPLKGEEGQNLKTQGNNSMDISQANQYKEGN